MKTHQSFWCSGHLPTLASGFLFLVVTQMLWILLGPLGNYIASDLGLNPGQTAFMVALPVLTGSLLRLVLGPLTDLIGGRKTGLITAALTLIPLLLGWGWAERLPQIHWLGLLLGIAGASFTVALPMVSRWYPAEHKGMAMGLVGMGNVGTVLAAFFAPRLAEAYGWHALFGMALVPLAVATVIFAVFAKDAPDSLKKNEMAEYVAVLKEKDTYWFCFLYSVTFGGFVGMASYLAILLRSQYGVSKVTAGDLTMVCLLAGSLMRPVGGWLADQWGGLRLLMVLYAVAAVMFLAVAQLPALGMAVALFFLAIGCLGLGNGAVFQLVPQRFAGHVGVATGIIGAVGGVGGFFVPLILGWLKQTSGSYGTGLGLFAGICTLALMTLMVIQRDWVGKWIAEHGRAKPIAVTEGA